MDSMEHCRRSPCLWEYRFEIVGMVLIIIGVFLTIGTLSGFGIGMMILVGGILCLYKHLGSYDCIRCRTGKNDTHSNLPQGQKEVIEPSIPTDLSKPKN